MVSEEYKFIVSFIADWTQFSAATAPTAIQAQAQKVAQLFQKTMATPVRAPVEKETRGANQAYQEVIDTKSKLIGVESAEIQRRVALGEAINKTTRGLSLYNREYGTFRQQLVGAATMQPLSETIGKVVLWTASTMAVFAFMSAIRNLAREIITIQTSLMDLKRVLTETDFGRAAQGAFDLAKAFGATTGEVLKGTFEWGKATRDMQDIYAGQLATLLSVKVAEMELSEATKYLTAMYHSLELRGVDLIRVIDMLNEVQNKFGANIQDVASVIAKLGGVIKTYGGDLTQMTALTATMLKVTGEQPTRVATALRGLIRYSRANEEGLVRMGIAIKKSSTEYVNLSELLDNIINKYKKLDEVSKHRLVSLLAEGRSFTILQAALERTDLMAAIQEAAYNSVGSAMIEYSLIMDTTSEKIKRLQAATSEFAYELGELGIIAGVNLLIDGFRGVVEITTRFIEVINLVPKPLRDVAAQLVTVYITLMLIKKILVSLGAMAGIAAILGKTGIAAILGKTGIGAGAVGVTGAEAAGTTAMEAAMMAYGAKLGVLLLAMKATATKIPVFLPKLYAVALAYRLAAEFTEDEITYEKARAKEVGNLRMWYEDLVEQITLGTVQLNENKKVHKLVAQAQKELAKASEDEIGAAVKRGVETIESIRLQKELGKKYDELIPKEVDMTKIVEQAAKQLRTVSGYTEKEIAAWEKMELAMILANKELEDMADVIADFAADYAILELQVKLGLAPREALLSALQKYRRTTKVDLKTQLETDVKILELLRGSVQDRVDLLKARYELMGVKIKDPLETARLEIEKIKAVWKLQPSVEEIDILKYQKDLLAAEIRYQDEKIKYQKDLLSHRLNMEQISKEMYIGGLKKILSSGQLTLREIWSLEEEIFKLQKDLEKSLKDGFQFNLPSIKLPTLYEITRTLQGGYIDRKTVTINVNVAKGADIGELERVLSAYVGKAVGIQAQSLGVIPRRY